MTHINFIVTFFILLFFALSELRFYKSSIYKNNKKNIFFIVIVSLICLAGFRNIGADNDSIMYYNLFNKLKAISYHDILFKDVDRIKEIGYLVLNKIFNKLGFRSFLIFCSIVALGTKGYILYRFSSFPFVSILFYFVLFYYLREYTQIRDSLATSFIMLCFFMYLKRKYLYSILFFIIGLSFHMVTLLCVITIILWEIYKMKSIYFYIFLMFVVFLKVILPKLDYFNNPFLPYQITKYENNFNSGYFLPSFSLFTLGIFFFPLKKISNNFLYFISLLTFVLYIYTYNHMVLIRIPNVLFFGNILLIGTNRYTSNSLRNIALLILVFYWLKKIL